MTWGGTRLRPPGCEVGCDCDRSWKYGTSFTQFNKEADGSYTPCNKKYRYRRRAGASGPHTAGVSNLFEVQHVRPILERFAPERTLFTNKTKQDVSLRLTEHLRSVATVADGIALSTGRGYVLAYPAPCRQTQAAPGTGCSLLSEAVPLLVELMGDTYPELEKQGADSAYHQSREAL